MASLVRKDSVYDGTRKNISDTKSREEKDQLEAELINMSRQLKERTQGLNQSLKEDSSILEDVSNRAQWNVSKLDTEKARLKHQLDNGIGLFTAIWLILGLCVVFFLLYIFMKIFPRKSPLF